MIVEGGVEYNILKIKRFKNVNTNKLQKWNNTKYLKTRSGGLFDPPVEIYQEEIYGSFTILKAAGSTLELIRMLNLF